MTFLMGNNFDHEAWLKPRTDHQMSWPNPFRDNMMKEPKNAGRSDRPVVDCGVPINFMDRQQNAERYGTGWNGWGPIHITHFTATPEQVPYTLSLSSDDMVRKWWIYGMLCYANWIGGKYQVGSVNVQNPRTAWCHRLFFLCSMARMGMALGIGLPMYFYGYEFAYTYIPFMRIRDPSPEGWKKCWQEGQSTYFARYFGCIGVYVGHRFFTGSAKRSTGWFFAACMWNTWYEWCRPAFSGNHIFYAFKSSYDNQWHSKFGSLTPDPERRIDPDTHRPAHAANYKYHRFTHGMFEEDLWKNCYHENWPFRMRKIANPYFNWQKAAQTHNEKRFETHNDVWNLPTVLNPHILGGGGDRRIVNAQSLALA